MAWWAWTLLALAFVFLLIAASAIRVHIQYSRMENNDRFAVQFRGLYGLIKYKIEVPVIKFKGFYQGIGLKAEQVNESSDRLLSEASKTLSGDKIVPFYKRMKDILETTFGMKDWIKETMAHVKCKELKWDSRVGLGDAPETAITTGVVWTLKASVLAYMFQFMCRDTKPRVRVMPQYNQNHFSTEISFIAQIRMIRALMAGVHLYSRIHKVEGGLRRWQNALTKPLSEG